MDVDFHFYRYGNITPYDLNRVILLNPVQGCDYVNASWISNNVFLQSLPTFIAAQGPLVQSLPHFLQMILENKVSVVVMLTEISEKGDASKQWMRV